MSSRILKACDGYTRSQGGLNVDEFRKVLIRNNPSLKDKINSSTRQKLNRMCETKKLKRATSRKKTRSKSSMEKKYCGCVAKVTSKQPKKCYTRGTFKSKSGCYNPYAVCTKSVGRTGKIKCGKYYSKSLTKKQFDSLARSKGMSASKFKKLLKSENRY